MSKRIEKTVGGFVGLGWVCLFFLSFFSLGGTKVYAEDPVSVNAPKSAAVSDVPSWVVQAPGQWFDGWYRGASGYDKAVEEYKRTQRPMVVYMSVGWCPYCRKFEREVLSSPLVRDFLKEKIRVMIDPESGQRENDIAFQYGIRGYPSFFLHPPQPAHPVQLYTGVTPEQFIGLFQEVLQ